MQYSSGETRQGEKKDASAIRYADRQLRHSNKDKRPMSSQRSPMFVDAKGGSSLGRRLPHSEATMPPTEYTNALNTEAGGEISFGGPEQE